MKKVVEICAGSYQDCLAAQKMGAFARRLFQ